LSASTLEAIWFRIGRLVYSIKTLDS
jgi:hypothetical protein